MINNLNIFNTQIYQYNIKRFPSNFVQEIDFTVSFSFFFLLLFKIKTLIIFNIKKITTFYNLLIIFITIYLNNSNISEYLKEF